MPASLRAAGLLSAMLIASPAIAESVDAPECRRDLSAKWMRRSRVPGTSSPPAATDNARSSGYSAATTRSRWEGEGAVGRVLPLASTADSAARTSSSLTGCSTLWPNRFLT
jgi:hypothetical protein